MSKAQGNSKTAVTVVPIMKEMAQRWSTRAFDPQVGITKEQKLALAEAARWAPSGYNDQPWRFLFVDRDDPARKRVESTLMAGNEWVKSAALIVIVVCRPFFQRNGKPNGNALFECGLATENMVLQAVSLGLAAHILGGFKAGELKKVLALPSDYLIPVLVAIGQRSEAAAATLPPKQKQQETAPRERIPLEQIVSLDGSWKKAMEH